MYSHHARLFFSTSTTALDELVTACEITSEVTRYSLETLAISDVRQLISAAYLKPLSKPTRTILVTAGSIAFEAQHALLKILEEPPLSTQFILWLRPGTVLLPTLRSRLALQDVRSDTNVANGNELFLAFRQSNYADRLEKIASVTKNKDAVSLAALAAGLGRYLATSDQVTGSTRSKCLWCLTQLDVRGASKKMLWEEVALLLKVELPD